MHGLLLVCGMMAALAEAEQARVVARLRDFEEERSGPLAPIKFHGWPAEQQENAGKFSQLAIVRDDAFGKQCGKLTIDKTFPWGGRSEYRALTIGPDYLPPEADAVRLRVKVVAGSFRLAVGSPTVYFGHSDVLTAAVEVTAKQEPAWQIVEFSLNHDLTRNFRRARFGRAAPVIHYTRWIQEPLYLYVVKPSQGTLLLDEVELVARGEGRPFVQPADDQIERVALIADFEQPADLSRTFTFFQEPIDLDKPPHLVREGWLPPTLARAAQGQTGKFSWQIEQKGTEEVAFAGIMATGPPRANAFALSVKGTHPQAGHNVVLDFLVYVAPPAQRDKFPWKDFAPPARWQKDPRAFTYYLDQERTRGPSYGFYHLRRTIPNGTWTTLVLPFPDFICAYGQGDCAAMFGRQLPLAGESIMALGLVSPYGQRAAATTILIDAISFVKIPGTPDELRSFWQPARKADGR
ncbi:MAG: hypothetical protein AB7K24_01120 [Gemmataceae bacterium]